MTKFQRPPPAPDVKVEPYTFVPSEADIAAEEARLREKYRAILSAPEFARRSNVVFVDFSRGR